MEKRQKSNTRSFSRLCSRIALFWLCAVVAVAQPSREYQFKAVCLSRFAQFVEWPQNAFKEATSPITVAVLGNDPFGKDLDAAAQAVGLIHDRKVVVERYRRMSDIKQCHILFISASEDARLESIFTSLAEKPVLTVGETDGFVRRGGMIRFLTVENKLRFKINPDTARRANLHISSKLLKWAEVAASQ